MADSNPTVTVVAILAIVILVALAAYFVYQETDDDIEIDLGLHSAQVMSAAPTTPASSAQFAIGSVSN